MEYCVKENESTDYFTAKLSFLTSVYLWSCSARLARPLLLFGRFLRSLIASIASNTLSSSLKASASLSMVFISLLLVYCTRTISFRARVFVYSFQRIVHFSARSGYIFCQPFGYYLTLYALMSVRRKSLSVCRKNVAAFSCCVKVL